MENRDGRNLGRNKMVWLLHNFWLAGRSGLLTTAAIGYAVARILAALLLGGMSWLLPLGLSAFGWVME